MPANALPRLDIAPSLTERTYAAIQEAILSFQFKPGDRLSVHRLSEQLGVSRTPVKEAFQRLEAEGLVSVVPRVGTFVSKIDVRDIDEILEVRALVEGFAAGRAARELTASELAEAEDILSRMAAALEEGKIAFSAEVGHGFHLLILRKLENERLMGFLRQVDLQYTRIRRIFSHSPSRQRESLEEHRGILARLRSRDAEAASDAMFAHHLSVRDEIVRSWRMAMEKGTEPDRLVESIQPAEIDASA